MRKYLYPFIIIILLMIIAYPVIGTYIPADSKLSSVPGTPIAGKDYYADGVTWDPAGLGIGKAYWVRYDGADYIVQGDEDGAVYLSSIVMPSFTHFATGDATYDDTTGDTHDLIPAEVTGGIITNAQTGGPADKVYVFPAALFGGNGMGQVIAAAQMDFTPDTGEAFWLNGAQMAANEKIQNTADTKGDVIAFWTVESGDGTYEWFFKSDNVNWVQETP